LSFKGNRYDFPKFKSSKIKSIMKIFIMRNDYWAYLAGILLAGLVILPLIYVMLYKVSYFAALEPSLCVSVFIALSVSRDGSLRLYRMILVTLVFIVVMYLYSSRTHHTLNTGGGFIMILITIVFGMVAVELNQALRHQRGKKESSLREYDHSAWESYKKEKKIGEGESKNG
jgi:hypothetical protein